MKEADRSFVARTLASILLVLLVGPRFAAANPAVYEVGDDPSLGFNLISWANYPAGAAVWTTAVQGLYDAGFRQVSISPVRYFNTTTYAIAPTSGSGPELSHIEAAVIRAKLLGMRVTLNPFVEPQGFPNWRGTYNPPAGAQADTFWADYQNYMVAVAQIGEAHGVEAMTVGTEYNAIDQDPNNNAHWNTVIDAIDAVYHGQLGYASNWDHYNNANVQAAIWDNPAIDFIGIDSYFSNTLSNYYRFLNPGATNPQVTAGVNAWVDASGSYPNQSFIDLMTAAWNYRLDNEILPYAAARKDPDGAGPLPPEGMPVAFTEIGYLHFNRTAKTPQGNSGAIDTPEQRMAFQGLLNALDGRGDKFEGMDIWQWWMPGSSDSQWNIDVPPEPPTDESPGIPTNYDQPNNLDLGLFLQSFVQTAVLPQAGDYNRDGIVDYLDYTEWRDTLGHFVTNYNAADGNGNGIIDDADYDVWNAHYGEGGGGPGAGAGGAVPEPSTMMLLAVGAVLAVRARR